VSHFGGVLVAKKHFSENNLALFQERIAKNHRTTKSVCGILGRIFARVLERTADFGFSTVSPARLTPIVEVEPADRTFVEGSAEQELKPGHWIRAHGLKPLPFGHPEYMGILTLRAARGGTKNETGGVDDAGQIRLGSRGLRLALWAKKACPVNQFLQKGAMNTHHRRATARTRGHLSQRPTTTKRSKSRLARFFFAFHRNFART